jgi:glutamyl-tRNA reductase
MLIGLTLAPPRAGLGVRERFTPPEGESAGPAGRFSLATCHRIELFGWMPEPGSDRQLAEHLAFDWVGRPERVTELLEHAVVRRGPEAARHLLRVAAGLESPIPGDVHVLHQLRRAYNAAATKGLGAELHRLLQTALRVGRRVRRSTNLVTRSQSVGRRAAELGWQLAGSSPAVRAVVVGAGTIGRDAVDRLTTLGVADLLVLNRSVERLESLNGLPGCRTGRLEQLEEALGSADLVVLATGARHPVLTRAMVDRVATRVDWIVRPLTIIDAGMPRNADPDAGGVAGVGLVDLDSLGRTVATSGPAGEADRRAAEAIVASELAGYQAWVESAAVHRALRPLRDAIREACRQEIGFIASDPVADRISRRIVAKAYHRSLALLTGSVS